MNTPQFYFFPEGTYGPLRYLPFLDTVDHPIPVPMPPGIAESTIAFFKGKLPYLNDCMFIPVVVSEKIHEKIMKNQGFEDTFLSQLKGPMIISFFGDIQKLIEIASCLRYSFARKNIYFHRHTTKDVLCEITQNKDRHICSILRNEAIISVN